MSGMMTASSPRRSVGDAARLVKHLITSSPSRFAIVIFAALILLFTGILSLPISSADGHMTPLSDALFTAVVGRDLLHGGIQGQDRRDGLGHDLCSCPAMVRSRSTSRRNAEGSPALSSGSAS